MGKVNNNSVYIPSVEANDIYCHMIRGDEIKFDYVGMIPYSLELIKLRKECLHTQIVKESGKVLSNDIINVKFRQKVKSGEYMIRKLQEKIISLDNDADDYKSKLKEFIKVIESEKADRKWQEVSNGKLREYLYENGFTVTDHNGKKTSYVVYKRSSSKSRKGECLFIRESLHEEMIKWSRMYLPFKIDMDIDLASLLAYESLVLSSLEETIKIDPKHILIVDDVESVFEQNCNVIKKGSDGFLESKFTENVKVTNSLFDGESLLDSDYFDEGQSMKLLRNHMFKSAAFNTNIKQFLIDNCPKDIPFDEWELDSMFEDEKILAKDVKLIITPSSLKALKFSHLFEGKNELEQQKQMWEYWQELVENEGSTFGVCKHEKKSKRGVDEDGNILQRTSYQMLNSIHFSQDDIAQLTEFEKQYIERLKDDDEFFIWYILETANDMNSNSMFADIYKRNKDIVHTKIFRDFRKSEINKYVTQVRKGKVRLKGDYCVMLGNPVEFLYHAIGKYDANNPKLTIKENEVHTKLFEYDKELVGFRNPHTSPSNVLIAKNTYNKDVDTYFNLTDNIVCVNAVNFPLQDILSGCDYDSDTIALFDSDKLREVSQECFGKYPVCINKVESQKKQYKLNKLHMSNIDNQLAQSQKYIGRVVNLGQLFMSRYWDLKGKEKVSRNTLVSLMKKVDVMTVLSGIAIDMAKKFYELDIEAEIKNVEASLKLKTKTIIDKKGKEKKIPVKPIFFKYISQSEKIKEKVKKYDCPMDYLYETMNELKNANHRVNVEFETLLDKKNKRNANRKQEAKIIGYTESMTKKINFIHSTFTDEDEKNTSIDNAIKYCEFYLNKLEVKTDTMYDLLLKASNKKSKNGAKLLYILHKTQRETFLEGFKQE